MRWLLNLLTRSKDRMWNALPWKAPKPAADELSKLNEGMGDEP